MQFLKTDHQRIVNENNEEIILQGYGAGNWMVQEAFLFGTGGFHADFKPFSRAQGMDRQERFIRQSWKRADTAMPIRSGIDITGIICQKKRSGI